MWKLHSLYTAYISAEKFANMFPNKTTISNNNNVTDLHGHDDRSELTTAAGRRQLAVVDLRRGGCT